MRTREHSGNAGTGDKRPASTSQERPRALAPTDNVHRRRKKVKRSGGPSVKADELSHATTMVKRSGGPYVKTEKLPHATMKPGPRSPHTEVKDEPKLDGKI